MGGRGGDRKRSHNALNLFVGNSKFYSSNAFCIKLEILNSEKNQFLLLIFIPAYVSCRTVQCSLTALYRHNKQSIQCINRKRARSASEKRRVFTNSCAHLSLRPGEGVSSSASWPEPFSGAYTPRQFSLYEVRLQAVYLSEEEDRIHSPAICFSLKNSDRAVTFTPSHAMTGDAKFDGNLFFWPGGSVLQPVCPISSSLIFYLIQLALLTFWELNLFPIFFPLFWLLAENF